MKAKLSLVAGTQIKRLRIEKNYTLDYVSFKTGINKSKLCKIENGQQLLDVYTIFILCNFYKIPTSDFITNIENDYLKKYPPLFRIK